ncbi:MAG: DNA-binding response regulator [Bacteroidetes bacterium HGW-Bacteroidetes-4]|jgi:DNA-binding LytR/AlgR family response regulator|nr:MAG: DNA-binding response regulator [Bacteroidetes bacterium HGW-Bacteroidetes-4]
MNCIIIDDDPLSRKIIEGFIEKTDVLNLVGSFESPLSAFKAFDGDDPIDLIFLDIEMPEMSGLEFINTLDSPPIIIIVTGQEKYALEAYEYDVVDYLLKPLALPRFYKSVNKAQKRFQDRESISKYPEEIFIKKKNSTLVRLKYDDILWVEALENYVTVNTFKEKFTIHFTMKAIENKLPLVKFKRVHRSYIVNIHRIEYIEDNNVVIKVESGSKVIPIGKSFRDNLMDDLNLISR